MGLQPFPVARFCAFVPFTLLDALTVPASTAHAAGVETPECNSENLLAGRAPVHEEHVAGSSALVTERTVVPEGALRDGPAMLRLEAGGSVTWDLGRARSIAAVVGQADANDTYIISVSLRPGGNEAELNRRLHPHHPECREPTSTPTHH